MHRGVLIPVLIVASAAAAWAFVDSLEEALYIPPEHAAIQYAKQPSNDPVARLAKKIESGQVKLDYATGGLGYLPALLKQLDVPVDSQVLVFSKGSIQAEHISPRTPRAIYFNDDAAVGYVQNGDALELTGLDPVRGIYLYTLDAPKAAKVEFGRRSDCLRCHEGPPTLAVPGLMVSSVHPRTDAREGHGNSFITDDRVPMAERWGGWYVTGTTGAQTHYGNNVALVDPLHSGDAAPNDVTQNKTSLAPPSLGWDRMAWASVILCVGSWLWSLVTSLSLMREAAAVTVADLKLFGAGLVKLDEAQISTSLAAVPLWQRHEQIISRTYEFKDFPGAMKFVNAVAALAEQVQHHPDMDVRWNKVTLAFTTHDAGGLTNKDFALARECDAQAQSKPPELRPRP